MSNFKITNPAKPEGSDIKGKFLGIDVELKAGESKEYPAKTADALKKRYPWLSMEDGEGKVNPSVPAEDGGEDMLTDEEEAEDKAKAEAEEAEGGDGEDDDGEEIDLESLNLKELRKLAKENGIEIPKGMKKKDDIVDILADKLG